LSERIGEWTSRFQGAGAAISGGLNPSLATFALRAGAIATPILLVAGAIYAAVKSVNSMAQQSLALRGIAHQSGMTMEQITRINKAAAVLGIGVDQMNQGIIAFGKNLHEMVGGPGGTMTDRGRALFQAFQNFPEGGSEIFLRILDFIKANPEKKFE